MGTATPLGSPERRIVRQLGAVQEAARLGCEVVGTEHLLMAAFADPLVRRVVARAGTDMRDVQALVTAASVRRRTADHDGVGLTRPARELIAKVWADVPELNTDTPNSPLVVCRALRSVMARLLTGDHDACAARRILDELGLIERAAGLVATIEDDDGTPRIMYR